MFETSSVFLFTEFHLQTLYCLYYFHQPLYAFDALTKFMVIKVLVVYFIWVILISKHFNNSSDLGQDRVEMLPWSFILFIIFAMKSRDADFY